MESVASVELTVPDALVNFVRAPFRLRTYTNLVYLMLAFPTGVAYFVFLITGLSLGLGLTIIWIGLPILALVFAASWGLAAWERQLAILALGAEIPPMTPPPASAPRSLWQRVGGFFSNPVTWKGLAFLFLKFPLGIVSFVATVALLTTSTALVLAPWAWFLGWDRVQIDMDGWVVDSPWAAAFVGVFGIAFFFIAVNLLNLLALVWRWSATSLLGSERFRPATPDLPVLPEPAMA